MKALFIISLSLISYVGFSQTIDSIENYVLLDYTQLYKIPLGYETKARYAIFVPKNEEIFVIDSIIKSRLSKDSINIKMYFIQSTFVYDSNCNKMVFAVGEVLKLKSDSTPEDLKNIGLFL